MSLTPVVFDLETFWSQTHNMSKINPIEYVMHPDTEIQSCSVTVFGKPTIVVFGEKAIQALFDRMPWHRIYAIGHNNAEFDAMILAWRFGKRPAMWGCTQAMMRALHAKETPLSLDASLKFLGAPMTKGSLEATNTKGKRLAEFTAEEKEAMREYNTIDGDGGMWLFRKLAKTIGPKELKVIDMTIRTLVDPKLEFDAQLLEDTLVKVKEEKRLALLEVADLLDVDWEDEAERIEEVRAKLASAPKFSAILEEYGFEVPMKPSKTALAKGEHKLIPALSKTDEAMKELVECDHPIISACAQARLGVKSTQLESRIETFLLWNKYTGGKAPMPLRYCGADTTGRWSGTFKANVQNMPRIGREPKHSDALRNCLRAPKGHKVVVADLSGIELRVNHFLWKVQESMDMYRADPEADLYRAFAAVRYAVTPEEVSKAQRQLAKVAQLGLGFGAGAATFRVVAKLMGGLELSQIESEEIVSDWRYQYRDITNGWKTCHSALIDIYLGRERAIDPWGMMNTTKGGIILPSGRIIKYPKLHEEPRENGRGQEWWYGAGRFRSRIYAGKIDENCLAGDSLVLTDSGWKRLDAITHSDLVHDGVEFVRHGGKVYKGVQACVTVDSVRMTPDHKVLTNGGWKEAAQLQGLSGASLWRIGSPEPRAIDGQELAVEVPVRLRNPLCEQVYDILNCGPRRRFVVLGESGPFVVHNCVQALARDVMTDIIIEFTKRTGLHPSLTVHDEVVGVCPEKDAEAVLAELQDTMRTPPAWWPELITWSEGDIADSYGEAK